MLNWILEKFTKKPEFDNTVMKWWEEYDYLHNLKDRS